MIIERLWIIVKGSLKDHDNGKTKTDHWKSSKIMKDRQRLSKTMTDHWKSPKTMTDY